MRDTSKAVLSLIAVALILTISLPAQGQSVIQIVNIDPAGEGFNDPTPAEPVGGNPGKTVGEQRLIAFQFAADVWGSTLNAIVPIRIRASFESRPCTASSGVLGSAGPIQIFAEFPGAEFPLTWYSVAEANKLAKRDLAPGPKGKDPRRASVFADDIRARFNKNLGGTNDDGSPCLTGLSWYYGLDANEAPNQIDLVAVLLHEFAHGLGFLSVVNLSDGSQPLGLTDIYSRQLFDLTLGKTWDQMTDAERLFSSTNSRKVVWTGANVTAAVPAVLSLGTPLLTVNSPAAIAGNYAVGAASFGPALSSPGVTGDVILADDGVGVGTDACGALTAASAAAVSGNIALVDRGACTFVTKVKNAQNAGAIAVIVADNVAGSPPAGLGGADPTITIPSVRITLADGNTIKGHLPGVNATLGVDLTVRAGADSAGRALMNAPNPVQLGSSISHWDPIAFPNQLMEPAINSDLTHSVEPPEDLTLPLFRDLGW